MHTRLITNQDWQNSMYTMEKGDNLKEKFTVRNTLLPILFNHLFTSMPSTHYQNNWKEWVYGCIMEWKVLRKKYLSWWENEKIYPFQRIIVSIHKTEGKSITFAAILRFTTLPVVCNLQIKNKYTNYLCLLYNWPTRATW